MVTVAAPKPSAGSPVQRFLDALEIDTRLLAMAGALAVIWMGFHLLSGGTFLTPRNLWNLAVQSADIAIMATGMVLIIVARHIALSVGSVQGVVAMDIAHRPRPPPPAYPLLPLLLPPPPRWLRCPWPWPWPVRRQQLRLRRPRGGTRPSSNGVGAAGRALGGCNTSPPVHCCLTSWCALGTSWHIHWTLFEVCKRLRGLCFFVLLV